MAVEGTTTEIADATVRVTVVPLVSVELRNANEHGFKVTVSALVATDAVIGYTGLNVADGSVLASAKVKPPVPTVTPPVVPKLIPEVPFIVTVI